MSTRIKETGKKNSITRRVKESGYTHAKADARKAKRRAEAEARQAKYDALSPEDRNARDVLLKAAYENEYINQVPGI